jgi:hypothetical protein
MIRALGEQNGQPFASLHQRHEHGGRTQRDGTAGRRVEVVIAQPSGAAGVGNRAVFTKALYASYNYASQVAYGSGMVHLQAFVYRSSMGDRLLVL